MGSVTGNFQSEAPLSKSVIGALTAAANGAWADPGKLPNDSRSARILLEEARATYSSHLGVRNEYLYFIGEVSFGYFLGIQGLLGESRTFYHSPIDRQEVYAIAARYRDTKIMPVSNLGLINPPKPDSKNVIAWQLRNGETGISQKDFSDSESLIFVDATTNGVRSQLPKNWATALFDPRAWDGPSGFGILAIADETNWNNPIPRMDTLKVPGGASLPLIIAGAIALEEWVAGERGMKKQMESLAQEIRSFANREIGRVNVLPGPHDLVSLSFEDVDAEYMVNKLDSMGFAVDSGSACKPTALAPSHVLEAMGQPTLGNLRIYIHHDTTPKQVQDFLVALKSVVDSFRNQQ